MLDFSEIKFLDIIPFIVFGGTLLIIFGVFISGAINLLFSRNNEERGKDAIAKALSYFILLLMIFLVFIIVSSLVRRGEIFQPKKEESEFPSSPVGSFPAPPKFIVINNYSFAGPYPLAEKDQPLEDTNYIILCEKDGEYDTIDIGTGNRKNKISSSKNYQCWIENCNKENLLIANFWIRKDLKKAHGGYMQELRENISVICE